MLAGVRVQHSMANISKTFVDYVLCFTINPFLRLRPRKYRPKTQENGDERLNTIAEVVAVRTNQNKQSARDARILLTTQHTNHSTEQNRET